MPEFKEYISLKRYGTEEVVGIESAGKGYNFVFPKLDGTNASVWLGEDGELCAGSRNRKLSLGKDSDNYGFLAWLKEPKNHVTQRFVEYFKLYPTHILYGEWIAKERMLKTSYKSDATKRFWVFDVYDTETASFATYEKYSLHLKHHLIDYIPIITVLTNGSLEEFIGLAKDNRFMLQDSEQFGEGIVIKNYEFFNEYGRQVWAKIVLDEYKEKAKIKNEVRTGAEIICDFACTEALIQKEHDKLVLLGVTDKKQLIPRLLQTVYYEVLSENFADAVKATKDGIVNFKDLRSLCVQKTKSVLPELFQ